MLALALTLMLQLPVVLIQDTSSLGVGISIIRIDSDGNKNTNEWLVNGVDPNQPYYGLIRLVSERRGQLTIGEWIDQRPDKISTWQCKVASIGVVDGIVCQSPTHYVEQRLPLQ